MKTDGVKPQTIKIWQMKIEGMSVPQIAEQLGLKYNLVNSAVRRGRDNGAIGREHNSKPLNYARSMYMRLGSISSIIDELTLEQREWLGTEAQKIGVETLSEYLLELVRDAHAVDNS
jgi:DNA-binding transcriptional regulator LsrR (DeoR family)